MIIIQKHDLMMGGLRTPEAYPSMFPRPAVMASQCNMINPLEPTRPGRSPAYHDYALDVSIPGYAKNDGWLMIDSYVTYVIS